MSLLRYFIYLFHPKMHHKDPIKMSNKKSRKVRKLASNLLKCARLEKRLAKIWFGNLNAWERWTVLLDEVLPAFEEPT